MRNYTTERQYSREIARLNQEFWQAKEVGDEARCGRIAGLVSTLEIELRYKKKVGKVVSW
jgi:hypothetical protein